MYVFSGDNPTTLYKETLETLSELGDKLSPRGKLIKELRPVSIEFTNPLNRFTFLATRRINPFFQLAESFQIVSGVNDAKWLSMFNANMINFSDNGENYNAFYGERIRRWGDGDAHGVKANGRDGEGALDQLYDVYKRILEDKDTRQAMIAIGNPTFDNYKYLNIEKGVDIACNLYIAFKVRDNKLHITVFCRSNDCMWGTYGANLCQFTTIQETLCSWLRNSGSPEFKDLRVGTYHQIADSFHIYLDSYGADINKKVLDYYKSHKYKEFDFSSTCEPRINLSYEDYTAAQNHYWNDLDRYIIKDDISQEDLREYISKIGLYNKSGEMDEYLSMVFKSMMIYRLVKCGKLSNALSLMHLIQNCQAKVSMMYFLKAFINKKSGDERDRLLDMYNDNVEDLVFALKHREYESDLRDYLAI